MIVVPEHIRALIFDCDGTLVDSMPLHMKAWEHAVTAAGGVWDYDFFFSKKGMEELEIVQLYNRQFGATFNAAEMVRAKHEFFRSHPSEFKPIVRVVDVAQRYRGKLPMAVASGSTRENVYMELERIGILDWFDEILTADDRITPKPAPDIFLEAAHRLGAPPHLCQVFEDGDLGLDAARKAGMTATDVRQ